MKITKTKLKQIIKEELSSLSEARRRGGGFSVEKAAQLSPAFSHHAGEADPRGISSHLSTGALTFEQWRLEVLEHLPYLHDYWEGKFGQNTTPEGYVEWITTPPGADSPYHPDSPDYKG